MPSSAPSLLLLIPAYNEEARIEPVLREYATYFQKSYPGNFQLVVVLNGCTDNTLSVVRRVAAEFPSIKELEFREPIGKGGALIEGLITYRRALLDVRPHLAEMVLNVGRADELPE